MKAFFAMLVALGPMGVFFLALIDSIGIPLPGGVDTLLVVVASQEPTTGYLCAALATLGSLIGSMILFLVSRRGGQKYLEKVAQGPAGTKFRRWFSRYGLVTVFVPSISVIPLPMKPFVACAGVLGVRPLPFVITILAARIPRYFFLAWMGQTVGKDAGLWIKAHTLEFALGLGGIALALFIGARMINQGEAVNAPE